MTRKLQKTERFYQKPNFRPSDLYLLDVVPQLTYITGDMRGYDIESIHHSYTNKTRQYAMVMIVSNFRTSLWIFLTMTPALLTKRIGSFCIEVVSDNGNDNATNFNLL